MALDKETYRFLASLFPGIAGFSPNVNAQQYGLRPDEEYFDMESGTMQTRTGNWASREGMEAYATELARQQYLAQVPEELRRAVEGGIGSGIFYGEGDRAMGINPLTGRPEGLSRVNFDYQDEGPTGGPGYGKDLVLPTSLVDKYFPRRSDSNAYQTGWVQKEMAPDDTFLDQIMPMVAAAPWAAALLPAMGAGAGAAGVAEAGAAGAFDAAGMAGLESGFGIGGAGMGAAAAGGTVAGSLMPPAVPTGAAELAGAGLSEIAPGTWVNAGNAAAFGSSLAPSSYAQFMQGVPPGAGIGAPGGVGPGPSAGGMGSLPPSPTTFKSIFDQAKELAPYAPLAGMALGAGAGALGGSGQAGTITVEEGIPDWLMPYVKPTLDKYSTEVQNYQTDPYGVMPAAMQQFKDTVSGMYLDPSTNKWLEEYYKLGAERIKGTLSPSFGHMQAFGSHSGYNEALSRGLGDFATGLYGGNYAKERDRQTQMTAAAPNFLTQASTSAFAPYNQYLSTVGNLGKKKDQPYWEPSMMQNILGGAMMGYGLGNIFK